jgi:hypothetical protein
VADPVIKVRGDVSHAERELQKLERALGNLEGISGLATKALASITAAAGAMGFAIAKTLDSAGQLIDAANNLGIAAQSLQALQHSAALVGVEADALNSALYKLNANIGSALINGAGGATDALKRLGIPINEIARLKTDEQFARLSTEINKIPNPAERMALATELFGKQGPKILQVADGLAAAKEEMEKLGLALSDADITALDMAGDKVDELKMIFESGLKKAIADIAPYIIAVVNKIKEAVEAAGGFEAVWQQVKDAIRLALNVAIIAAAIGSIATLVSYVIWLRKEILLAKTAMELFNAVVKRNPIMMAVMAAIALAGVLGVDVVGALEKMSGINDEIDKVNGEINKKADELTKKNKEQVQLSDQLNKKQQEALDALNESIKAMENELGLQKTLNTNGQLAYEIEKAIVAEKEKLAKAGMTLSSQDEQRIANVQTALFHEKSITEEMKRQESVVKNLSDAYKSDFTKSLEQFYDVQRVGEVQAEKMRKKQFVSIQEGVDLMRAQVQSEINLKKEVLALTDTYGAAKFAIEQKYEQSYNTILQNRALLEEKYGMSRQEIAVAAANIEIAKENELYELRIKHLDEEQARRASTLGRIMSDGDAYFLKTIGGEKAVQDAAKQRAEFEQKTVYEKTAIGIEQGAQLFSALGAQNKKAFEAAKALNIASAIMSTYTAVTKALAAYPFPFSLVPAGAALAMGMAQVAQIRSQQYSGRALGGPVMGSNPYIVGENGPELFTPNTAGSITKNSDLGTGGTTNVNFTIQANDAEGFDSLLVQRKGMIQQMISDAMLERGQRSKM